jgi:hypothetical protein
VVRVRVTVTVRHAAGREGTVPKAERDRPKLEAFQQRHEALLKLGLGVKVQRVMRILHVCMLVGQGQLRRLVRQPAAHNEPGPVPVAIAPHAAWVVVHLQRALQLLQLERRVCFIWPRMPDQASDSTTAEKRHTSERARWRRRVWW